MGQVTRLKCTICGAEYAAVRDRYTCDRCGEVGTLDALYDLEAAAKAFNRAALAANSDRSMWRYRALLPVAQDAALPPLEIGGTPLYNAPRLAESIGLRRVWVKDDGQNPTGSLKDRASAVAAVVGRSFGAETVTTASTGNAGAALAGVAAAYGMPAVIFAPATAPEAKIAQLLVYGARVVLVRGTYSQAFDICAEASAAYGWYNRNTGTNPYTTEGKKTAAYEIAEGLGWHVPDVVVVGVGDGSIIGGLHKGFRELHALRLTDRVPRLLGVQAEGSSPLVHAWKADIPAWNMAPVDAHTVADSISSGLPRDRVKALRAVRNTGGAFVSVPDEAILAAIPELARGCGVFAEPAAAATWAGLKAAFRTGLVSPPESAVLLVTGNGLKDVRSATRVTGSPDVIDPTLDALQTLVKSNEKSYNCL